jgi:hypothetical protein
VALPTRTFGVTHPDRDEGPRVVRRRRFGYFTFGVLATALVASALVDGASEADVWGVSSDRARAEGGGYELEVRYPTVSRPGLGTPFDVVVRRGGGFDGPVDIAIDSDWLQIWDRQALVPEPSGSTAEPGRVVLSFEPPSGDVLRVFLDGRIKPARQSGRDGWVAVLDASGAVAAEVAFTTAVRP